MTFREPRAAVIATVVACVCTGFYVTDAIRNAEHGILATIGHSAGLFLACLGAVYSLRNMTSGSEVITPHEDYGWSFGRTLTLGSLAFVGLLMASLATGFVLSAGVRPSNPADEYLTEKVFTESAGLFVLAGYYFLGRWLGYKCKGNPYVAIVVVVVIVLGLTYVVGASSLRPKEYEEYLSYTRSSTWHVLLGLALVSVVGMLGAWRGRRNRGAYYLRYLLRALPPDTRTDLIDLAYSETIRHSEKENA